MMGFFLYTVAILLRSHYNSFESVLSVLSVLSGIVIRLRTAAREHTFLQDFLGGQNGQSGHTSFSRVSAVCTIEFL